MLRLASEVMRDLLVCLAWRVQGSIVAALSADIRRLWVLLASCLVQAFVTALLLDSVQPQPHDLPQDASVVECRCMDWRC